MATFAGVVTVLVVVKTTVALVAEITRFYERSIRSATVVMTHAAFWIRLKEKTENQGSTVLPLVRDGVRIPEIVENK